MPLATITIAQALRKLRMKECSAQELALACIDRIEAMNPTLNAVVHTNFERALEQAKNIDASGGTSLPLGGIPYLAKDVFCEAGVPTTACSNILRNKTYTPPFDSTTTKRLTAAGAISLGKANTDEFTMGSSTETSCYGVTRNPWDVTRVAGGSSGGSAAGVAADMGLFALGTDTGGSIREPSAFCNCTGLRPTYGRTSRFGVMSMASSLDTIGPICKTVEDIALVMNVIAGKDPLDGTTVDKPVPDHTKVLTGNVKGMKIGLPKEYFIEGLNPEIETSVHEAVAILKDLGATITEISLPHSAYATATYYVLCPCEVSSNMARYDGIRFGHTVDKPASLTDYYGRVRSEGFGSEVKRRIMIGTYALSSGYYDAYYRQAQKVRTLIRQDFNTAFRDVDIIAAPVTPNPAFTIGIHDNDPIAMYLEDIFLVGQVMAGIPAMSVPCGFTKTGLPLGLQLMGAQWSEELVLRCAHAYEQATRFFEKKPAL
ncbi:MAG: aspartyl-tRNA(Asn)/glutamyl-tRNA (Gln) amidotransferase subunit A [Candidatus Peregrinibacteria bacterium Gr01-1014_25]|nr:MAG: aspartyl-tRNA(Asn)/glutamyl-tRNA (Gln) amidotransferase subunit A [Candidatus Peregrinibacteria bacterium Gr01-1014_25]